MPEVYRSAAGGQTYQRSPGLLLMAELRGALRDTPLGQARRLVESNLEGATIEA